MTLQEGMVALDRAIRLHRFTVASSKVDGKAKVDALMIDVSGMHVLLLDRAAMAALRDHLNILLELQS